MLAEDNQRRWLKAVKEVWEDFGRKPLAKGAGAVAGDGEKASTSFCCKPLVKRERALMGQYEKAIGENR
jgi:hypothetical protein